MYEARLTQVEEIRGKRLDWRWKYRVKKILSAWGLTMQESD